MFNDFQISQVKIEQGEYKNKELQLVIITNPNARISYKTTTFIGGYFGGNRISSINKLNLRLGDKFNSSLSLNYNNLSQAIVSGANASVNIGAQVSYSVGSTALYSAQIAGNAAKIAAKLAVQAAIQTTVSSTVFLAKTTIDAFKNSIKSNPEDLSN